MGGLLVYIPTYNRPELLRAQLERLRPQIEPNRRVRLIVADNASTSLESQAIVSEYAGQGWLTVLRRASNIEANANILQGFLHLSRDEYLWILADDTLASEGAIDKILAEMDSKSPNLIGLSIERQEIEPPISMKWGASSFEQITQSFTWGLISSAIYSGSYFLGSVSNAFFFHNSSFPHLGVLFSAFRTNGTLTVSWIPTTSIHGDNSVDGPSDYSLAVVGFPQLMYLLEPKERKRLVNSWLKTYSAGFAHFSKRQPMSASSSLVLLRSAGLTARFRLRFGQFEAFVRSTKLGLALQRVILKTPWLLESLKASKRLMFKT